MHQSITFEAMRIYAKIIPRISNEIIARLVEDEDIEVEPSRVEETELDMSAIMKEFIQQEQRLTNEAKILLDRRGLPYQKLGEVRRHLAVSKGIKQGDEGIEWLINQMLEYLLNSNKVVEVYSEDNAMRKKIYEIFKKYLDVDEDLDKEVRSRIKNFSEGTAKWEVAYSKTLHELKRVRGLVD